MDQLVVLSEVSHEAGANQVVVVHRVLEVMALAFQVVVEDHYELVVEVLEGDLVAGH